MFPSYMVDQFLLKLWFVPIPSKLQTTTILDKVLKLYSEIMVSLTKDAAAVSGCRF